MASLVNKPVITAWDTAGSGPVRVYHVGRTVLFNECMSLAEAHNHARVGCIFNSVGAAYVYSTWGNRWYRITFYMHRGKSSVSNTDWKYEDLPAVVKTMEMVFR